jgi:hypothetical protein
MSTPKVGERVPVVIEATLSGQQLDWVLTDHGRYKVGNYGVTEIEIVAAPFVLPTKRWAQVSKDNKSLWTQTAEFGMTPVWVDLDGETLFEHELMKLSGLRVISEGVDDE